MYLHRTAYLIPFFFILVSSAAYPAPENPPLEEIYKSGKIELITELIITRDNLPDDLGLKYFTGFTLWKGNLYFTDIYGCRINMLSETGQYIKTFGRKGKGPSDLYYPSRLMSWVINLPVLQILPNSPKLLAVTRTAIIKGFRIHLKKNFSRGETKCDKNEQLLSQEQQMSQG